METLLAVEKIWGPGGGGILVPIFLGLVKTFISQENEENLRTYKVKEITEHVQCAWAYLHLWYHDSQDENILNIILSVVKITNDSLTNAKDGDISEELAENIDDYKTAWWWTSC